MIFKLAWRNLWRSKTRSIILVVSITIGFFGLFFFYSVMKGALRQVITNVINSGTGHIQIHVKGYLEDPDIKKVIRNPEQILARLKGPEVAIATKRINLSGIINSPEETRPVQAIGGILENERKITNFARYIIKGKFPEKKRDILMGKELAELLKVDVGDKVVITSSDVTGDLSSFGFRVCGIFDTPSLDVNKYVVIIPYSAASAIAGYSGGANEIVVKLTDSKEIDRVKSKLKKSLGEQFEVLSWDEIYPLLKYEMEIFSEMMLAFGFIILLAAAFGIAEVFFMSLYERMREIGVLRAIGLAPGEIAKLVFVESFLLFLVSIGAGGVLNLIFYLYFVHKGINLSIFSRSLEIWGSGSVIYPYIQIGDIFAMVFLVFFIVFLSVIFPMRKARKITAVEALKYV